MRPQGPGQEPEWPCLKGLDDRTGVPRSSNGQLKSRTAQPPVCEVRTCPHHVIRTALDTGAAPRCLWGPGRCSHSPPTPDLEDNAGEMVQQGARSVQKHGYIQAAEWDNTSASYNPRRQGMALWWVRRRWRAGSPGGMEVKPGRPSAEPFTACKRLHTAKKVHRYVLYGWLGSSQQEWAELVIAPMVPWPSARAGGGPDRRCELTRRQRCGGRGRRKARRVSRGLGGAGCEPASPSRPPDLGTTHT